MARKRRGHGEGTVYQRPDGRWCAQATVGVDQETGRLRRVTVYAKTRAEAAARLAELLADARRGVLADPARETVDQFLQRWLETVQRPRLRPRTYESYVLLVRRHVLPVIGRLRLDQIKPPHLQELYARKLQEGLSPNSVRILHAILHRALAQAVRWGMLPRNPADAVDRPRPARKEPQVLTPEQVRALLEAARGDRLYPVYVLAVTTGMRLGELLGLAWGDVDLSAGRLHVRRQLVWLRNAEPVLAEPKTAKGRRLIELPPLAVEALRQHRRRQAEERLLAGPAWRNEWDLVFTTALGTPLHPSNLRRTFRRLLELAGLPRIRFHDLRHTVATLLLAAGTHPKLVQEQLGHSTVQLTLDTYSHVLPSLRRQVADTIQRLVAPSGAAPGLQ